MSHSAGKTDIPSDPSGHISRHSSRCSRFDTVNDASALSPWSRNRLDLGQLSPPDQNTDSPGTDSPLIVGLCGRTSAHARAVLRHLNRLSSSARGHRRRVSTTRRIFPSAQDAAMSMSIPNRHSSAGPDVCAVSTSLRDLTQCCDLTITQRRARITAFVDLTLA